jgi:hypothetical protein
VGNLKINLSVGNLPNKPLRGKSPKKTSPWEISQINLPNRKSPNKISPIGNLVKDEQQACYVFFASTPVYAISCETVFSSGMKTNRPVV